MNDQSRTDRNWQGEAAAWRARAEHLQATVDRLRSLAVAGESAGFLAHELNNLFTPVVGYCHAARAAGADDVIRRKALEKSLAAAERVGELAGAILRLAGTAGDDAVGGESDLRESVRDALMVLGSERWKREGVSVVVSVPRGTLVRASAGVVQQVVMNLVLNARRAMAGRSGAIEVSARAVGAVVRMEVRDGGGGMSAEVMGRVMGITKSDVSCSRVEGTLTCREDATSSPACTGEGGSDRFAVDVQELARSGSINGQARWGVRVVKGESSKLKAQSSKLEGRSGEKVQSSKFKVQMESGASAVAGRGCGGGARGGGEEGVQSSKLDVQMGTEAGGVTGSGCGGGARGGGEEKVQHSEFDVQMESGASAVAGSGCCGGARGGGEEKVQSSKFKVQMGTEASADAGSGCGGGARGGGGEKVQSSKFKVQMENGGSAVAGGVAGSCQGGGEGGCVGDRRGELRTPVDSVRDGRSALVPVPGEGAAPASLHSGGFAAVDGLKKKVERLRGAKIGASASPIRIWDAEEVAAELRGGGAGRQAPVSPRRAGVSGGQEVEGSKLDVRMESGESVLNGEALKQGAHGEHAGKQIAGSEGESGSAERCACGGEVQPLSKQQLKCGAHGEHAGKQIAGSGGESGSAEGCACGGAGQSLSEQQLKRGACGEHAGRQGVGSGEGVKTNRTLPAAAGGVPASGKSEKGTGRSVDLSCETRDVSGGQEEKVQSPKSNVQMESGGTGLGLALCLELVGRVGGRLWAESVVGEGTVMYIEWPMPASASANRAA